ncbi:MAG TPA: hypothetical protein ENN03_10265 [bacterium]|nr:hypothetical protein [bacterium]
MNHPSCHLLLTNGRTGSNFIRTLIQSHPQMMNYGEVLGPWTPYYKMLRSRFRFFHDNAEYIEWILHSRTLFEIMQLYYSSSGMVKRLSGYQITGRKSWKNLVSIGIKEFYTNLQPHGCLSALLGEGRMHLIALVRNNTLQRYVSWMAAEETGVWVTQRASSPIRIKIDIDHMMNNLPGLEEEKQGVIDTWRRYSGPKILIEYEKMFADPLCTEQIKRNIIGFLHAKALPVVSGCRKILPERLDQKVLNYEAMQRALASSPFNQFLDPAV